MKTILAFLLAALLGTVPAAAQPFPLNSQGLFYNAFTPTGWAGITAAVTTGNVALGSAGAANTPFVAWVQNTGAVAANVVLGKDNTVVATLTSGTYVAAGQCVALNALGATYLAAITASSTTNINIMTGAGVPGSSCGGGGGGGGGGGSSTIVSPLGPTTAAANSVAVVFGSGATLPAFASTPAFTISGAVPAGTNLIGKVGIDQTTPGTTNGVQVNAALPAGTNLIGKTGIDQTTPGTTNGVQVNAALPAGTNLIGKTGIDQTTPGTTNGVVNNAGTAAIGYVGGFNASLSNAPTVQNAAYSASNAIGGLQTVAAFRNTTQPSGIVNYVQVISAGGSTQGMTIYGWTKTPSATCTDKVAYAANAADNANAIPGFPVVLTPAVTQGTTASRASTSIVVSVKNTDSSPTANLYFCAVVNGSVTPASTTDLTFGYSIAQD